MKKILSLAHISIFAGILLFGCGSPSRSDEAVVKIKAPDFLISDINGKPISLASLKGKVVFLDFWATWCPPCVWSSPSVEKLTEIFKGKKLEVISISLDRNIESVKNFYGNRHLKTRVAISGDSELEYHYRVSGIPAFYLIDQEGYLVKRWSGFHPALPEIWQQEISKLLK